MDDIGVAYRLIDVRTGKSYRRLVPADRLKPYTADRTDLMARLPSNMNTGQKPSSRTRDDIGQDQTEKKKTVPQQQVRDESDLSGCESCVSACGTNRRNI